MSSDLVHNIEEILNESINDWTKLGNGLCNTVYKITTHKNLYSIKVVNPDADTQETNPLLVEAKITQRLNQRNPLLPIPKIKYIDPEGKFYIYNFINNTPLGGGGNERYVNTLLSEMGKFHNNIDCVDKNTSHEIGISEYTLHDFMLSYGSGFENFLINVDLPDYYKHVIHTAFSVFENTKNENVHEQLLHNDIHGENIFLNTNGELDCVIDFGDAVWGDIHLDMMWYVHGYPNDWEKVINSYEANSGNTINKQKLIALAYIRFTRNLCQWYLEGRELDHCNEKFRDYKNLMDKFITI